MRQEFINILENPVIKAFFDRDWTLIRDAKASNYRNTPLGQAALWESAARILGKDLTPTNGVTPNVNPVFLKKRP